MAVALLIALMTWQCSRPDVATRVPMNRVPSQSAPVSSAVVEPNGPSMAAAGEVHDRGKDAPAPAFQTLSPEELEEWKRKNEESMKILEKTTPELPSDPRTGG